MHTILTKVVTDNLRACPRFVQRSNNYSTGREQISNGNILEYSGIFWNILEYSKILQDIMEYSR